MYSTFLKGRDDHCKDLSFLAFGHDASDKTRGCFGLYMSQVTQGKIFELQNYLKMSQYLSETRLIETVTICPSIAYVKMVNVSMFVFNISLVFSRRCTYGTVKGGNLARRSKSR
jgi:hypothetical protein